MQQTTDPRGLVIRTLYDQAGRAIATIRHYVNGTPSGVTGDDDVYTRFTYSAGRMTEMWVDLDGDGVKDAGPPADQVTTYTYGVTKGASPPAGDSLVSSNDLLWKMTYPHSASGTDLVTFAYNAQGQEIYKKDQAGNVLETEYDTAGRKTDTRATTINTGAGFDDAVKRITLAYLSRGLVDTVTQRDATTSGSVLNEIKYEYDAWGNISKMYQDRDSAVSAGNNEAQVAFAYSAVTTADGTGRARVQHASLTLPHTLGTTTSAPVVTYTFGAGANIAEVFGRVSKVSVNPAGGGGTVDVTSYEYQGAGTLVTTKLITATADTAYRMHSGTSGSGFSGYMDNFGRVTRSQWKKLLGSPVTLYDLTLTYDRDGNITSADDAATGGSGAGWDVKYGMDSLNRLTDADEGTLSTGSITSRTRRERWDQNTSGLGLDQVGNWARRKLDLNGDGDFVDAGETDDSGAFNAANEWQTRDVDSNSSTNYTLAHDAVGNMTDDGKDYTYVYDVFGRLVKVKVRGGGATVAEYGYDGLGQRIWFHADEDADGTVEASNHDPRYNFVYDDRWRIIATYRVPYSGSDTTPKETYVWHMAGRDGQGGSSYTDSVILRDRDNSNGWTGAPDGTLEERRFYLQNWRADVSAVCNTNGRPLARVKYSAYGVPITLTELDFNLDGNIDPDDPSDFIGAPYDWDLDGDTDATDSSNFAADYGLVSGNSYGRAVLSLAGVRNILGYAGYVGDRSVRGSGSGTTEGGQGFKWHVRYRMLDSGLGRWTRRDPLGYVDGMSMYGYVRECPMRFVDPLGLAPSGRCEPRLVRPPGGRPIPLQARRQSEIPVIVPSENPAPGQPNNLSIGTVTYTLNQSCQQVGTNTDLTWTSTANIAGVFNLLRGTPYQPPKFIVWFLTTLIVPAINLNPAIDIECNDNCLPFATERAGSIFRDTSSGIGGSLTHEITWSQELQGNELIVRSRMKADFEGTMPSFTVEVGFLGSVAFGLSTTPRSCLTDRTGPGCGGNAARSPG